MKKMENGLSGKKLIFVGGFGRSGTTLIQKVLSLHTKIIAGPEFEFTYDIFNLYNRMNLPRHKNSHLFYYENSDALKQSYKTFFESFFQKSKNKKNNAKYISEKTPVNILVADTLLEIFTDAVFINVVRDGRDVLLSNLKVRKKMENDESRSEAVRDLTIRKLCHNWNTSINMYHSILNNKKFAKRVYNIQYEAFVKNPEKEIKALLNFLKIDYEDQLLSPENISNKDYYEKDWLDGFWYDKEIFNQPINQNNIGKWKRELNMFKRIYIELIISPNLCLLGYPVSQYALKLSNFIRKFR